ncbi:MAG: primary-amine oxidase [Candidatus Poriferisodalaceae bacterium]|jgi:primary-amine oxidase
MYPLDPLSEAETTTAVGLAKAHDSFGARMRFASVDLRLPVKSEVLAFVPEMPIERCADIVLFDGSDGSTHEVVASLTSNLIVEWNRLEGVQPSIILDEFFEPEIAIKADPAFQAAMAKRGITDMELVTVDPWSSGHYGDPFESSHRIIRGLIWVHEKPGDNQYARPIDGLMVIFDLTDSKILRIDDERVVPVPSEAGEWSSEFRTERRDGIKPLDIVQPEGPSFTIEGNHLSWQKWNLHVGWNTREGLVINTVSYTDGDEVRPVLYRASLAEMTVPYGDPSSTQARKNAFDVGEYGMGMLANSLTLGCDCLGEIHYLDAHFCDAAGDIVSIPQAICIHEEDFGISWKHYDFRTEHTEVRRLRRLVVSFIATVGNYEYGIYWYFYQDGRIENEIKLTGVLSTGGLDTGEEPAYGTKLGEHLYAPNHQHFFCTRLDMSVDGLANSVVEVDTVPAPADENPFGNAFRADARVLATESQAQRRIDPLAARFWKVVSTERTNKMGAATGYKLLAGENCLPFATQDSSIRARAGYMWNHLWVTPYAQDERWPAGEYPNQSTGGEGLPAWTAADRNVENTDVVLWYTMGHNHLPSLEDWPVMPVATVGFTLKPSGFFDHSPVMDLPPSDHCHVAGS